MQLLQKTLNVVTYRNTLVNYYYMVHTEYIHITYRDNDIAYEVNLKKIIK